MKKINKINSITDEIGRDIAHSEPRISEMERKLNHKQYKNKIYDSILQKEGAEKQVWKVIEELGELQTALAKHARQETDINHVMKELVDAEVTIDKLRYMIAKDSLYQRLQKQQYEKLEEDFDVE